MKYLLDVFQITKEADAEAAIDACHSKFGRLDFLVNTAGVGVAFKVYNFNKKRAHTLPDFARVQEVCYLRVCGLFQFSLQVPYVRVFLLLKVILSV